MLNVKNTFHIISYVQYPFMFIALYYAFKPYIVGFETLWENSNNALIFMGLGISFSTLQDTTKPQNKLSRKTWENPKKGKIALTVITIMASLSIIMGLYGILSSTNEVLKELSFGIIVIGIGLVGLLKTAIEMFENHRLDKKL